MTDNDGDVRADAAAAIALMVACKIFTLSIKGASMTATAHRTLGDDVMASYKSSRSCSLVIFLLSVIPSISKGTIAAAATTGPASGPRPASSIPMTKRMMLLLLLLSVVVVEDDKILFSCVRGRHHISLVVLEVVESEEICFDFLFFLAVFFVAIFVFGLSLFVAAFVLLVSFSFFTAAAAVVSDEDVDRVRRCLFLEAACGVGSDDGNDDDDDDSDKDDDRDDNGAFAATAACTPRSLALRRRVVEAAVLITIAEDDDNMHVVTKSKNNKKDRTTGTAVVILMLMFFPRRRRRRCEPML
jgi:hypothetical protein